MSIVKNKLQLAQTEGCAIFFGNTIRFVTLAENLCNLWRYWFLPQEQVRKY